MSVRFSRIERVCNPAAAGDSQACARSIGLRQCRVIASTGLLLCPHTRCSRSCCSALPVTRPSLQSFVVDVLPLDRSADAVTESAVLKPRPPPPSRARARDAWSIEPSIALPDTPLRYVSPYLSYPLLFNSLRIHYPLNLSPSRPAHPLPHPLLLLSALVACARATWMSQGPLAARTEMTLTSKAGAESRFRLSCRPRVFSPPRRLQARHAAHHEVHHFVRIKRRRLFRTANTQTALPHRLLPHRCPTPDEARITTGGNVRMDGSALTRSLFLSSVPEAGMGMHSSCAFSAFLPLGCAPTHYTAVRHDLQ